MSTNGQWMTVVEMKRRPNSANGNPRWAIVMDNGQQYVTKADAMWAYTLTGNEVGPFYVTIDKYGVILDMER